MSDEAEVMMLVYVDLKPEEEAKLKSVDEDVWNTLKDNGIRERAVWDGHSAGVVRSVRLAVPAKPKPCVLLSLAEEEVAKLSAKEVVARLRSSLV
jgi:hypothetical protein